MLSTHLRQEIKLFLDCFPWVVMHGHNQNNSASESSLDYDYFMFLSQLHNLITGWGADIGLVLHSLRHNSHMSSCDSFFYFYFNYNLFLVTKSPEYALEVKVKYAGGWKKHVGQCRPSNL